MSTTMEPESEEVTKNTTTINTAMDEITPDQGNCSRKWNNATAASFCTSVPRAGKILSAIIWIPESPNTVIHSRVKPAGTSITPRANSRIDRPREMRAMNMPTNGDQEIHQPQ